MASRASAERWLADLTNLPTAPGLEHAVIEWVRAWAARRDDLRLSEDSGGNLLLTQKGRKRFDPVVAVAHMDHPAFVITGVSDRQAAFEFRGGVREDYFQDAAVVFVTGRGRAGRVLSYDPGAKTGTIGVTGPLPDPGDIARWRFPGRNRSGRHAAPACDDLAGCAAALAALDRARGRPELRHLGVLLTRAEEAGFIGALHAARSGILPETARIISIEASRASAQAPVGGGPVIRVGDASTVFDAELTNRISSAASRSGIPHQRRLMAGGSCEATAFGGLGYRATGLCLPMENYHNMGNLDVVEEGRADARSLAEEVALSDFHALVDLLHVATEAVDAESDLPLRLEMLYQEGRHLLGPPDS